MESYKFMINGQLIASEEKMTVKNPATGELLGYASVSSAEDVHNAVNTIKAA